MSTRESASQLMRVLVADDDRTLRSFLSNCLQMEGMQVIEADNGHDALSALMSTHAPPIAILDWNMPVMDGIEVCREIRKKKDHGLLYIILITGAEQLDVVDALDSGADDFIRKPFRREELRARVRAGLRIISLSHEKLAMISRLQEQERLESIGRLAAGIAHEINTPMQYIGDNTKFIQESLRDILQVIDIVRIASEKVKSGASCADELRAVEEAMDKADLEYLNEQIPLAVSQSMDGIGKVTKIVRAMKELAHPGSGEATPTDLNHLLETAVTVTRNEWKYVSDMETDFALSLPPVTCYPADLNQAVINMIVNAAHAVEEKQKHSGNTTKGRIHVSTLLVPGSVEIRILDTGMGIPESIRGRVMDPFFTTKEVGKGTGQGLAIARSAIVDKHRGTLDFETEEGVGTTFIIRIPMETT
jgi:signal transduction histidine kinase